MVSKLLSAIQRENIPEVRALLSQDRSLAQATLDHDNPIFTQAFYSTTEKMQQIRALLLGAGADINYRYPDGSTLGHSFASTASTSNRIEAFAALILWIQAGGDVSLVDDGGHSPLEIVTLAGDYQKSLAPGSACARAILIGLDKRTAFPTRIAQNGPYDNLDELDEMSGDSKLLSKLERKGTSFDLKQAYSRDSIAYRAFRDLLRSAGADFNRPVQQASKGTLGHVFAMEAANRDDFRKYLRLIRWIRDGGDVTKQNILPCNPLETLVGYASYPENTVPFKGLQGTVSILQHVKCDTENDPAALTDARAFKHDPYKRKGSVAVPDMADLEVSLKEDYQAKILQVLQKAGISIETLAKPESLDIKMKLIEDIEESEELDWLMPVPEEATQIIPPPSLPLQEPKRRQSALEIEKMSGIRSSLSEEVGLLKEKLTLLQEQNEQSERTLEEVLGEMELSAGVKQDEIVTLMAQLHEKQHKIEKVEQSLKVINTELAAMEDALCCPLSQEKMKDPVISTISFITFERSWIEDWLTRSDECPVTRKKIRAWFLT